MRLKKKLTANAFASCIVDYIEQLDDSIEEIVLYSDGCTYHNRNVVLANALLQVAFNKNIQIVQKILEKGHTQMEVHSVHSVIERKIKNKPIYSPQSYVDAMRECRPSQPYNVKYVSHEFFRDYSSLNYYQSIRPGVKPGDHTVTDLRVLKYNPLGIIMYKLHHDHEQFHELLRRGKPKNPVINVVVPRLYNQQIRIKVFSHPRAEEGHSSGFPHIL